MDKYWSLLFCVQHPNLIRQANGGVLSTVLKMSTKALDLRFCKKRA